MSSKIYISCFLAKVPLISPSSMTARRTGTGTNFGTYLSPSPKLKDNFSMEKLSKLTLNTNYFDYLSVCSSDQPININFMLK